MSYHFTEIDSLDFDLHDGEWKCHIADTDRNITEVRVEAETTLHVAQKSSMFYHLFKGLEHFKSAIAKSSLS